MAGRTLFLFATTLASAVLVVNLATAHGEYRVKPSTLAPMDPRGSLRRVVHGFGNWTLICDEDLARRERVCNVSQEIVDEDGRSAFSWSLAATRGGAPVMILRKPSGDGRPTVVELALPRRPSATVDLRTCDPSMCIGFLPVTRSVGEALRTGGVAQATFMRDGRLTTLDLPLAQLTAALAAMRVR